jgi:hypothetical protein
MSATARPGLEATVAFASALTGDADHYELVELRYRHSRGGMGQRFFSVARPDAVATAVAVLGRRSDVYLAVCPRIRRDGSREAIRGGWAVWADCDGAAAAAALKAFKPEPAIVVRSGVIWSARVQRGCERAVRGWRHVVSEADWVARGGGRDGR